jgi:prolyl-tRNA synthetase
VVPTNVKDATLLQAAEKISAELEAAGYDVLIDDRDERPGVKFKDADLVGIPYRVNVGKKLAEGKVEVVERAKAQAVDVALDSMLAHLLDLYNPRA